MRFGRKKQENPDSAGTARGSDESALDEAAPAQPAEPVGSVPDRATEGPKDASEVDLEAHDYLDLGSLLLAPDEGTEVQIQVDESSGQVISVVLLGEEGGVELRAFAAARGGNAWAEVMPQVAAETSRLGGTATPGEGPFGPELSCIVPVEGPEGAALQTSRAVGVNGPRWLLRATLLGRPAVEPDHAGPWDAAIRRVVVRRGTDAMAPLAPLPLRMPPQTDTAHPDPVS